MTAAIRIHRPHAHAHRAAVRDLCDRRVPPARPMRSGAVRPRPSEATFRRRRAIVGTVLAAVVAVGAVATHDVLAGSGGDPASAAASQPAHVGGVADSVVARPGDTLWSIAEQHRGEVSITRYVDALVSVNGGASIQAGQLVLLP